MNATAKIESLNWMNSPDNANLFTKADDHGTKDEKGRSVGATACLWRKADGSGFYGNVNPTRDGRYFGSGRGNVRGATFEEVAKKLDAQLAESRAATLTKYGVRK